MEIRFTFNPSALQKQDIIHESEDTDVEELQPSNIEHPRNPKLAEACTRRPKFSVTVTDHDEDVCPIDIEGMEFGEAPSLNKDSPKNNGENRQDRPKLSKVESVISQASKKIS